MSYLEYKGLAGVKNVGGVPDDELVYLVRAVFPQSGAATLIVSAAYEASASAGRACGPPYCMAVAGAAAAPTNCLRYPVTLTTY